jgi:omega-hydroxy-beta-dihydromenaquinone-9 sulfotransferase
MSMILIGAIVAVYVVGVVLAPFPDWRTYRRLWRHTLRDREPAVDGAARRRQVRLLVRHLVLAPLWTFLWYLDECLYPTSRRQPVRPIFIIGQPRSGSTLLHRTLARDTARFIAIRHLEWRFPYIAVQKLVLRLGLDRWAAGKSYWSDAAGGREAAHMHPNTLYDWEEDGIFFEECFFCHYFVLFRFPFIELLSALDDFSVLSARERRHLLAVHRRVIQKILYLRQATETQFYLSKEVESMTKMAAIAELYPDARFITVARRSDEFLSSLLALIQHSTRSKTGVDTSAIPTWKAANIAKKLRDCGLQLTFFGEQVTEQRQIRVPYSELCRDRPGAIAYIYHRLNIPVSPPAELIAPGGGLQPAEDEGHGYTYPRSVFPGFEAFDAFVDDVEREYVERRWSGQATGVGEARADRRRGADDAVDLQAPASVGN